MKVSVSVLKEYDRLFDAVNKVNESKADFLHVDVMDGKFVNNQKFPLEVVKDIKKISKKPLDVHLMVEDCELIKKYADIKPDYITFHVEVISDSSLINYVKKMGIKVGLAINPETNVKNLISYANNIDLALFMSVTPGYGGQTFKEEVINKIREFKNVAPSNIIISVDGGVNDENVSLCKRAGCNMVVSGSYVTNSDNYDNNIEKLR